MGLVFVYVKEERKKRRGNGGIVMKEVGVGEFCWGKKMGFFYGELRKGRNDI